MERDKKPSAPIIYYAAKPTAIRRSKARVYPLHHKITRLEQRGAPPKPSRFAYKGKSRASNAASTAVFQPNSCAPPQNKIDARDEQKKDNQVNTRLTAFRQKPYPHSPSAKKHSLPSLRETKTRRVSPLKTPSVFDRRPLAKERLF